MKQLSPEDEDWERLAGLGPVQSVMDPRDRRGHKNAFIDLVHKMALRDLVGDEHERFLDFGCGSGRMLPLLSRHAHLVVGVDRTLALLRLAGSGQTGTNRLVCADGAALPFRDNSFDGALAIWTMQYLQDSAELTDAAARIGRCLKPGAPIYLLEQASVGKEVWQHDPEAYIEAFTESGFVRKDHYAIRNGRDLLHYAVRYGLVPRRFHPPLARREMRAARRPAPPWVPYRDFIFVFRKALAE